MSTKRGRCHLKGWPGGRTRRIKAKSVLPVNKPTIDKPVLTVASKRRWFQRKDGCCRTGQTTPLL